MQVPNADAPGSAVEAVADVAGRAFRQLEDRLVLPGANDAVPIRGRPLHRRVARKFASLGKRMLWNELTLPAERNEKENRKTETIAQPWT